jgi:branched-chain amino acid transport system substrate-binding protein
MFSSTWAQTNELLEKGGQVVEGLELGAVYHPQHPSPAYQQFLDQFETRFQRQPGLAATHAYESILVLARALEQTNGRTAGLPEALIAIKHMEGVQGTISMDEYGEVKREVYIAVVQDGKFQVIHTIQPIE